MIKFLHNLAPFLKKPVIILLLVCVSIFAYSKDFNTNNFLKVKVVKCYPNPATSYVNFEFPENINRNYVLQVYSFTGKKMADIPVSSSKISLTLSNEYFRGIYIFQLRDKSGKIIETGKFQVVK